MNEELLLLIGDKIKAKRTQKNITSNSWLPAPASAKD